MIGGRRIRLFFKFYRPLISELVFFTNDGEDAVAAQYDYELLPFCVGKKHTFVLIGKTAGLI